MTSININAHDDDLHRHSTHPESHHEHGDDHEHGQHDDHGHTHAHETHGSGGSGHDHEHHGQAHEHAGKED